MKNSQGQCSHTNQGGAIFNHKMSMFNNEIVWFDTSPPPHGPGRRIIPNQASCVRHKVPSILAGKICENCPSKKSQRRPWTIFTQLFPRQFKKTIMFIPSKRPLWKIWTNNCNKEMCRPGGWRKSKIRNVHAAAGPGLAFVPLFYLGALYLILCQNWYAIYAISCVIYIYIYIHFFSFF